MTVTVLLQSRKFFKKSFRSPYVPQPAALESRNIHRSWRFKVRIRLPCQEKDMCDMCPLAAACLSVASHTGSCAMGV